MHRQRPLGCPPNQEHRSQQDGVDSGRHRVWHAERNVHDVCSHRAEDPHGRDRQPVQPRDVAATSQLHAEGADEDGEPREHGHLGRHDAGGVVGNRLAERGRRRLRRPEQRSRLGNSGLILRRAKRRSLEVVIGMHRTMFADTF